MTARFQILPRIGVARLGNSPEPDAIYLGPDKIGGLPIACDASGNVRMVDGKPEEVRVFKDSVGRIKRQAQKFQIWSVADGRPVTLADAGIASIEWTVHIANKKPIWFTFSELQGDLEFGPANSYANQHIPLNNGTVTDPAARQALIIDPGPRSISKPGAVVPFSRYNIPDTYPKGSFPPPGSGGQQIDTLGELRMDAEGNLVALGGFGNVTGSGNIASFRGAGGFWDDVSDGYVMAQITYTSGDVEQVDPAWLIVGSPKYAPEVVNITTLFDTAADIAVRFHNALPDLFGPEYSDASYPKYDGYTPLKGFNPDYIVEYETDVKPIFDRIQGYRWVADIPYLASFANPGFNMADPSEHTAAARKRFFSFFRVPVLPAAYAEFIDKVPNGPNQLFSSEGIPLLPLNSGDNSVTNQGPIYKFETLSATQYFFLYQWSVGKFTAGPLTRPSPFNLPLEEASMGNCVGAPFSPGIETTWIVRCPAIYDAPLHLKVAHFNGSVDSTTLYYATHGLSTTADEQLGQGCEPGDLTKRMAIPWQADFQECTVQTPNITNSKVNQFADGTGIEVPPTYYVYWWPPQSPMHVVTGTRDPGDQVLDAYVSNIDGQPVIPAGQRVEYQRGIAAISDMIQNWSRLGFVVNQGAAGIEYLVEQERDFRGLAQYKMVNAPTSSS